MSTVWTSVSISLTAVHSYVPALCLEIDGISRYSSSDARSPMKGHTHKVGKSGDGHSELMQQVNSCGLDTGVASAQRERRKVSMTVIVTMIIHLLI